MFEEGGLGTIASGKLADIVVLNHGLMTEPAADILKTHIAYTILDGKVMYRRSVGFVGLN